LWQSIFPDQRPVCNQLVGGKKQGTGPLIRLKAEASGNLSFPEAFGSQKKNEI
jgi:hypothetical protein